MERANYFVYDTALGPVTIVCRGKYVVGLHFGFHPTEEGEERESSCSKACCLQLAEYLAGTRREFDLPLKLEGTPFQLAVWQALQTIPYGQTRSYADIAAQIGNPKACRAVGMANHRNPVAIIVPCHRVVGKNGALTGYASGLEIKKKLLELEKQGSE